MNKNIEKKISKENYGSCTEISRCKVKNFPNKFYITETMSCKSKARKKSVNRSDHKHNYVDAVIMYKIGKDDLYFYLGKVCSICGKRFEPNNNRQLTCSDECGEKLNIIKQRDRDKKS